MKRSDLNGYIRYTIDLLEANAIKLPSFAYWTADDWKKHRGELDNIKKIMLGWDVSDFGSGDFLRIGAVLFTIRNGSIKDKSLGTPFAEKIIVLRHENEQYIPMHCHHDKTEDIINRGGGILAMELYASTPDGGLDKSSAFDIRMDGFTRRLSAGETIEVPKGCSITLTPGIYHRFWAKKGFGDLVAGEVSSINDDNTDNYFVDKNPRFSDLVEDEPAVFILCNEYEKLLADA